MLLATITGGAATGGFELVDGSTGIRLWLDATDSSTLFTDTAGTSIVASNGDPVRRWGDKSGYGVSVVENDADDPGDYNASEASLNGRPAVSFVGGGDGDSLQAINTTGIEGNDDRTVFTVHTATANTGENYQHTFHMGDPSTNRAFGISVARADNNLIGNHYWSDGFNSSAATVFNSPNIAAAIWDGDAGTGGNGLDSWFVDGAFSNASDRAPLDTGPQQIQIASRLEPAVEGFTGHLSEVLLFDRALNDAERIITENSLSAKYNVPLVANNVYDGDELAANYDLHVFGIGQQNGGSVTAAGAAGFGIEDASGTLADGEFVLAGHNLSINNLSNSNVDAGITQRWSRIWRTTETGVVTGSLAFDYSDGTLPFPTGSPAFALLFSTDPASDPFSDVGVSAAVNGDTVTFSSVALESGYYTLGRTDPLGDPPTVDMSDSVLSYTENDGPVIVDASVVLADADSPGLLAAVVAITSNYDPAEDTLSFTDTATISGAFNRADGTLVLSGADSVSNYEAAVRSVTYTNASEDPSLATRMVSVFVTDGNFVSNGPDLDRDISITQTNDAPSVAISSTALPYILSAAPIPIDPAVALADIDLEPTDTSDQFSATISITSGFTAGDDKLSFVDTPDVQGALNASGDVLTLSAVNPVTLAEYESALRNVTFRNGEIGTTATRTVEFVFNDGTGEANSVSVPTFRDITVTTPAVLTGGTATGGFELANGASSLRLWLDSTDAATLFTDAAGTVPVTDGGDVARWNDKSGFALDVSQGNAANVPSYQAAAPNMNGLPVVSFIGGPTGDALTAANLTGIEGNDDRTVINVWRNTDFTGENFQHTFHMGNAADNQAYGISTSRGGNAGSAIGNHFWAGAFDSTAVAGTNPTVAIAAWDGDGGSPGNGSDSWRVNGVDAGSSDQLPLNTGNQQLQIGSRLDPFVEGLTGGIAGSSGLRSRLEYSRTSYFRECCQCQVQRGTCCQRRL